MKIHRIGEMRVAKIRGKVLSDLYEARMAIWKAAGNVRKQEGRYPTHIFFSPTATARYANLVQFLGRYGAGTEPGLGMPIVPGGEFWLGYFPQDEPSTRQPGWAQKPSLRSDEVRAVWLPRRRGKIRKVNSMFAPLEDTSLDRPPRTEGRKIISRGNY